LVFLIGSSQRLKNDSVIDLAASTKDDINNEKKLYDDIVQVDLVRIDFGALISYVIRVGSQLVNFIILAFENKSNYFFQYR
jgi:hypothetical protein